jgi:hypothetical protein
LVNATSVEVVLTSSQRPHCGKKYIGQIGRSIRRRSNEHLQSFKYPNSNSTFAKHLHDTGHSFGPMERIMDILYTLSRKENLEKFHSYSDTIRNNANQRRIYNRIQLYLRCRNTKSERYMWTLIRCTSSDTSIVTVTPQLAAGKNRSSTTTTTTP